MKYAFFLLFPLFLLSGCTTVEVKPEKITSCSYEGASYRLGELFPAADGVNECECRNDGTVTCSENPIPKNPAQCEVASDCEALNLETFCNEGSWSCIENLCEYSCDINGMVE